MANINLSTISLGPEGGSSAKIEEGKTLSVTANGSYTVSPSEGYDAIADATVTVDVTNPPSVYTDTPGMGYAFTKLDKLPSNLKIAARKGGECEGMFANSKLTDAPAFDMSKATSAIEMFSGCKKLKNLPSYDTSNVADFTRMFSECQGIATAPTLSLSLATITSYMYYSCKLLASLDNIFDGDLPTGVVRADYMFYVCFNLKTGSDNLGEFLKHCTTCESMFRSCTNLITLSKATLGEDWVIGGQYTGAVDCKNMFYGCTSLAQLPCLDMSNVMDTTGMFSKCTALKYLHKGGLKNLRVSTSLAHCPELEHDSLVELLNVISTVDSQNLILGSTNLEKLTDEEKAIATNKGWTLK